MVKFTLRDAHQVVDVIGGLIASTRYFKIEEVQGAFSDIELIPRLEKVHALTSKYLSVLQNLSQIKVALHILNKTLNPKREKTN